MPREIPRRLKSKRSRAASRIATRNNAFTRNVDGTRVSSTERCKPDCKPRVERSEKKEEAEGYENKSGVCGGNEEEDGDDGRTDRDAWRLGERRKEKKAGEGPDERMGKQTGGNEAERRNRRKRSKIYRISLTSVRGL